MTGLDASESQRRSRQPSGGRPARTREGRSRFSTRSFEERSTPRSGRRSAPSSTSRLPRGLKIRGAPVHELAEHLAAAEPSGDEWVAKQLEEAGGLALRQGASAQAVRYLSRALAEQPMAQRRPEMLLNLARAEASLDATAGARVPAAVARTGCRAHASGARGTGRESKVLPISLPASELGPMLQQIAALLGEETSRPRWSSWSPPCSSADHRRRR